jgi:hypothetical protein
MWLEDDPLSQKSVSLFPLELKLIFFGFVLDRMEAIGILFAGV